MSYHGPEITLQYLWWLLFSSESGILGIFIVACNLVMILAVRHLFLRDVLPIRRITIPSFFLWTYCILMLFPSVIFFQESVHLLKHQIFAAIQLVPSFLMLGVAAGSKLSKNPERTIHHFLSSPLSANDWLDRKATPIFYLSLGISVGIIGWYVSVAPYVPLIGAITDYGAASAEEVRFSIYQVPTSLIFLFAFATRFLNSFCLLFSFFMWNARGGKWRYLFVIALLWTLFGSFLTFERQHAIAAFALLGLASYISHKHRISKKLVLVLALATLAGGIVSRAQYNSEINIGEVVRYAGHFFLMRVWIDPAYMTFASMEWFYNSEPLLGKCVRVISVLFGTGCDYSSAPLTAIGFLSDLWVNFRWVGIVIGTTLYGFVFQFVQLRVFTRRSCTHLAIFTLFLLNTVWTIYGNMLSTMVLVVFFSGLALILGLDKAGFLRAKLTRGESYSAPVRSSS